MFLADRYGIDADPRISHAISNILADSAYGKRRVSVEAKSKDLLKWGARTTVGTGIESLLTAQGSETEETFVTDNDITTVVSTSSSDTQNITVLEGHTLDGTSCAFYNFGISGDGPITLTGTTPVTLPTALFRASRARLSSPAVGNIHFYEGGTRTDAITHLTVTAGEIQTQKAATTLSGTDFWLIGGATGSVLEKTGAWAQFRIEIKPILDTYFYPLTQWVGVSDASGTRDIVAPNGPLLIVPSDHDFRIATQANAANVDVAGGAIGMLARVLD